MCCRKRPTSCYWTCVVVLAGVVPAIACLLCGWGAGGGTCDALQVTGPCLDKLYYNHSPPAMRFMLFTSTAELADSRWLQQQRSSSQEAGDATVELGADAAPKLSGALNSFHAWAQELQAATADQFIAPAAQQGGGMESDAAAVPAAPSPPHTQLLLLAEALHAAAAAVASITRDRPAAPEAAELAALIGSQGKDLCQPLMSLAAATERLWTAAAAALPAAPCQAAACLRAISVARTADPADDDHEPACAVAAAAAAASDPTPTAAATPDAEQLKPLLLWLCHLTTAAHKVRAECMGQACCNTFFMHNNISCRSIASCGGLQSSR